MSLAAQRALLIIAILATAVTVMAVLLIAGSRQQPPMKEDVDTSLLVDTLTLEQQQIEFVIPSQGTLRPKTETTLSAEVAGTIIAVSDAFAAGGLFEAGDILLAIDPTNYRVAVTQAEALVRQRQVEYDGALRLREKGFRAESEVAAAEAQLASAKAELTRARRDLSRTEIRLPYAGMVRRRDVDLGDYVSPGTPLGVAFTTDVAELRLPLTDDELAFIDLPDVDDFAANVGGPSVTIVTERAGRTITRSATLVRQEGVVDEVNRVNWVVAELADPYALETDANPVPMGSFVRAGIEGTTLDDVIRVPRSALRRGDTVLLVDGDNRLRVREVDVLRSDAEYAYLAGGVSAGDRLIMTALEAPVDGMALRTADAPATQASGESVNVRAN